MGSPVWFRPRAVIVGTALVVSLIGAVIWSNVVAGDRPDVDDEVTLDEPGEYLQPGAATNPTIEREGLPEVPLRDVRGVPVDLATDGPMVVNVWFSTCPPCARELVEFADVERELGDRVRFVGVNPMDDPDEMLEFAAARDVDYELLVDDDGEFVDELGIVAFPVTLLVDPDGSIVAQEGTLTGRELRALIEQQWGIR